MLFDTLQADYIIAFKARDTVRKDALNFVIAQLKNKKIELQKDLEDTGDYSRIRSISSSDDVAG
jgi:uncharacterized protein YqeY